MDVIGCPNSAMVDRYGRVTAGLGRDITDRLTKCLGAGR